MVLVKGPDDLYRLVKVELGAGAHSLPSRSLTAQLGVVERGAEPWILHCSSYEMGMMMLALWFVRGKCVSCGALPSTS